MNISGFKEETADDRGNNTLMDVVNDIIAGKSDAGEDGLHKYMKQKVGSIIDSRNSDEVKLTENKHNE